MTQVRVGKSPHGVWTWLTRLVESVAALVWAALWQAGSAQRATSPCTSRWTRAMELALRSDAGRQHEGHFLRRKRAHEEAATTAWIPLGALVKARATEGHEFASTPRITSIGAAACQVAAAISRRASAADEARLRLTARSTAKVDRAARRLYEVTGKNRCRCFARRATPPAFLSATKVQVRTRGRCRRFPGRRAAQ